MMMCVKRKVVIVQEYVPAYRLPFYEMLNDELSRHRIRLVIAAGVPGKAQGLRGDAVDAVLPFVTSPRFRTIGIGGKTVTAMRLAEVVRGADLVIAQQELRHLETHGLLARQLVGGAPVALWGHGRDYAHMRGALSRLLFQQMTRQAGWFFAYTEGGADAVARIGFPPSRTVVIQNAIDTNQLSRDRAAVTAGEIAGLRRKLCVEPTGRVCLFLGALDSSKRLDFLLAAGDRIAEEIPEFTLVVAGDGPQRQWLTKELQNRSWARYVGRASGGEKALMGATSDLIVCPGAVGLVAVDSFALGTPLVTTEWELHGPEFEYLESGTNSVVTQNSVGSFVSGVVDLLRAPERLASLREACFESARTFTIEAMTQRFAQGVLEALSAPRRRPHPRGRIRPAGR